MAENVHELKKPKSYLLHATLLVLFGLILAPIIAAGLGILPLSLAFVIIFFAFTLSVFAKCFYVNSMWKDKQYAAAEVASATAKDSVKILAIVLGALLLIGILVFIAVILS